VSEKKHKIDMEKLAEAEKRAKNFDGEKYQKQALDRIKKIYNNLSNNNKDKKYGETDLLKDGNQYYPPKP